MAFTLLTPRATPITLGSALSVDSGVLIRRASSQRHHDSASPILVDENGLQIAGRTAHLQIQNHCGSARLN